MNLKSRILAAASSITLLAGLGLVGAAAPAGAVTPINVGNDHVVCNTLSGTISFATALKISGPTTGSNTITIKAALGGCTDTDNSTVKMFSGTITGTLTSSGGTNCSGLSGLSSSTTGNSTTVWKPASGQAFSPTITVGTSQKPGSVTHVAQTNGATFTIAASQGGTSQGPWAGTVYGEFQVGTTFGTTAESSTADFTGGDGGASGWFEGTTQQDEQNLIAQCFGAGIKSISFGLGAIKGG
jgi:hypothetical protein